MNIRIIVSIGLLLLPGACAVSSGMAALTYAANGVSYASSGKGLADHALSASADKDCAMHRAIEGKDICERENSDDDGTLMTMIDTTPVALRDRASDDAKPASDRPTISDDGSAGGVGSKGNGSAASALESIYSLDR